MRKCPRCRTLTDNFTRKTGYCRSCSSDYNRIWKSNHKKYPPKGEVKGNWRKAERDFPAPPITMCYLTPKGGMLCGFCKTEAHYIGTRSTAEGKEDQFFCSKCYETIFVPRDIYPRLRIWADAPTPIRQSGERYPVSSNGHLLHLLGGGVS